MKENSSIINKDNKIKPNDIIWEDVWKYTREVLEKLILSEQDVKIPDSDPDKRWVISNYLNNALIYHKTRVKLALQEGMPVPKKVLEDYPEFIIIK
jgi:hypothetical protein